MQAATLIRTGSGRFQFPPPTPPENHHRHGTLPVLSRTRSAGAAGFSARASTTAHLEMMRDHHRNQDMRGVPVTKPLRRAASCDPDPASLLPVGYSSPAKSALLDEIELEFSGGGAGSGSRVGGGGRRRPGEGSSGDQQRSGMADYYKEMLQADPENPLLLINYGKFLHEVQGDLQGAEDCFGRAVLASPGDAEALSLYGNLMWEAHRDEDRAEGYLQRAVQAAPDDCYVLGSYAHFLWDADDEEDQDNGEIPSSTAAGNGAVMVNAY